MLKSIALAAAIALTGGGLAMAQNQTGAALVDSLFAQAEQQLLGGISAAARARGVLAQEGVAEHTVNLQAGKSYIAIGVCDEGCSDLDMAVASPSGERLGMDTEMDDTPIVAFQAATSGRYTATVAMSTCGAAQCNYGVRFYEQ